MAAVDFPGPALADRAEKLWTKDDYFAASAAGLLERCELIDGRIYSRVNAGAPHNAIVSKLTWALGDAFERELVWIEKEVEFPGEFHPQPDVTLLSRRVVDPSLIGFGQHHQLLDIVRAVVNNPDLVLEAA